MKKVFIASILLSSSLFLSRVIGYLRDAIIAAKFGAGVETDAYFAAFTLPDFLNYMVAGGAFSITFIPIFTNYIVKKKEDDGWRLYSIIISVMSLIIVTAIVILEIFTPQIVSSLFPGFKGDILDRTIFFTRIVLPAQLFFYNGGIISAILMSKKRFLIPALAPLIYNISIIVFGVALSSFGMTGFAIGVLIGAFFGPFFIQFWALRKEIKFKFLLKLKDPDFIRFIKLSLPLIAGLILVTLDDWLSKRFGSSFQQGTVSWINNSRRLVLVPIGLFAQANAQALLPFLSEYFAKKEFKQFNNLLKSGITFVIFITTFASSWFIVFHYEIIRLIYQRGAFLPFHTLKTSEIFLFFCFGIPFWGG